VEEVGAVGGALPLDLMKLSFWASETATSPIEKLTDREFEVFQLIGQGLDSRTIADAWESAMKLQSLAAQLHTSLKQRWAPKGVYRFKSHEEADEWMNRMLARSQMPKS